MNISALQECIASAVRFIQDSSSITAAPYFDEIPENFIVPSMFFPVPRTKSYKATLSSWWTDIMMECWFAAPTDWEAFGYADEARDSILAAGCAFDIRNADGTASGAKVRVTEPEVRKQEDRIVCMSFTIKNFFEFEKAAAPTADSYNYSWFIKAWQAATAEQREEEEEQSEWLEEAAAGLTEQNP